ncbi:hypothetical protein J4U02_gp069 [Mycobacterium phage Aziz]|uniref:Uncharacterized protein n=3 Tax=Reyvirus TaxID=1623301 RepID=A0A7G9A2E0_9CAUD|nr:hypothetical protein J4U02_gp069 [Mycobacterium phage Aziz]YP_010013825.1 hypothetical protein J4U03_gp070 [Mycobacterium phage Estes]YP_010013977.1 hypothetical protein J4U04_gp071 [Mycobacterium phage MrMagoo]ARM70250.1 hypothetical protein SEA_GARDENSALSA_70 [Mycobacterium phage GardenSalsa]ASR75916.1 hypothetical protein SEA_GENEVAB15_70 [Mycobacterium phage GenevaB15]APQ42175.1 hypothetical protein PBI_MRMAGOO_71 [Mycobacterium phage MrMagoo]QNJ56729.1 hypothetical protein SEA_AZIZ_69
MAYPSNAPSLPVNIAELVYVAFSHTLDYLDKHGHFPPEMQHNMRKVAQTYERDRTAALNQRGVPTPVVQKYTATAASRLAEWIDEQAEKHETSELDFEQWAKELASDDHS